MSSAHRGILTCVAKSVITPVAQVIGGSLEFDEGGETFKYPYLNKGSSTRILGLNITNSSWQTKHVTELVRKGGQIARELRCMTGLSQKAKLHLIKALVIPTLTYPCAPLNACSAARMGELQIVLNKALNFVYNNRHPNMVRLKTLHERAKINPINITIYKLSKNTWDKIEAGTAGDRETFTNIMSEPQGTPHGWFPSSYSRAQLAEPPPIFIKKDSIKPEVKRYYKN